MTKKKEKWEDTERFSVAIKECDKKCQAAGDKLEVFQEELVLNIPGRTGCIES